MRGQQKNLMMKKTWVMMTKSPHKHVGDEGKPGQIINKLPTHAEYPLKKLLDQYENDSAFEKGYKKGFEDGYKKAQEQIFPNDLGSEYGR